MHQPLRRSLLSLGFLFLGLIASCNKGRGLDFSAEGTIDETGGTLTVTSGPLTGTTIVIPPGAVTGPVHVEIGNSYLPRLLGFENVGPGTFLSPSGMGLLVEGTATLMFDPALVPVGATAADIVVFRQTSQGRRVDMVPKSVDMATGSVLVDIDQFASYWVSVRTRDLEFLLPNFLPLLNGDTYVFDNGIAIGVKETTTEPKLEGLLISKMTFVRDGTGFGLYLSRDFADTFFAGGFTLDGALQEIVFPPLAWLGATGVVGTTFFDRGVLSIFEPLAAFFPSEVVEVRSSVTIESAGSLTTPMGIFSEVLEVSLVTEREDEQGNVTSTFDTLWLARGVGPVQIELDGIPNPRGRLTGGFVAGFPIVPR